MIIEAASITWHSIINFGILRLRLLDHCIRRRGILDILRILTENANGSGSPFKRRNVLFTFRTLLAFSFSKSPKPIFTRSSYVWVVDIGTIAISFLANLSWKRRTMTEELLCQRHACKSGIPENALLNAGRDLLIWWNLVISGGRFTATKHGALSVL